MRTLLVGICVVVFSLTAMAAEKGLVTKPSQYSVSETLDRLEAVIRPMGFHVAARVDFKAVAGEAGNTLRPHQLLIFGRGGAAPVLLPADPLVGIDLPLKVLAWEDANGKVWLAYNTGDYIKQRHAVKDKDEVFATINKVLESVTTKALE